ncbi:tRNA (N(6)-L-threonylcarbamoyladenosine(37)-C(2))-methylthiotransferase MtaB|uniref:Threonylcarbamoyladenosine tRNA methylthiotransferase MtaB n=1 Tax=Dendrosporobacter quercicolus TaxID=146817 RepID=A0A1G9MSI3_9FIRM|nr:tRNA (N(6)-L-threonylcarbamoyladenosine(37)-C(2))-methylthiotransferase MtaB [Dendrosporobacter quercicolus]NSL47127.1 tRNA (N(6)-L-threonylcarbamoyladenosine(37)-C(2))-methylthiotransferase MtaB [Dendrosporobacter quercicolus DSM 1736]SDL77252.1 threonylcarbamoyladenosine tRNA methylthiotransferase MtaB [Dendrosporobacter quercicolus]
MPRVAFTTLGCKVNQFETEIMEGLFKQRHYEVGPFDQPADVYVINTCSVTHLGERKSRQLIRRAARLNADAVIAVTGCYAQVSPEQVENIPGVNVIVGTKDRDKIVDLVEQAAFSHKKVNAVTDIMKMQEFEDIPLFAAPGRTRAFLKIQEGCTNYCTYCIIPYARGPLRSRPLGSIAGEARKLVKAGFKEIVLTGIHLGAYGRDFSGSVNLVDAVKTVLAVKELQRLRLGSLESVEVADELIDLMQQDGRLCRHLHLPLQAGDNQVLAAMNRHYTVAEFEALMEAIMNRIPDIAISTDIIVGFPGETEKMFANGLQVIDRLPFSRIHVFPYSRRSGTPAAAFAGQVSEEQKKQRAAAMSKLAEKKSLQYKQAYLGRTMEVLFESADGAAIDGLTVNYLRVYTSAAAVGEGKLQPMRLDRLYLDGIWGTVAD